MSLAFWFADINTPYVAGCCGSPGIITNPSGAQNVFDDTTNEWPQVSWETRRSTATRPHWCSAT